MTKEKEYIIRAECVVHFRNGLALNGDLNDFLFCEDTKALKRCLNDRALMERLKDKEIAFVNLDEVITIDVKHPRVMLPAV